MKTTKYLPINWVNGLKLTSRHFIENQYSQTEALNNEAARIITNYNYGLGDSFDSAESNLKIELAGGNSISTVSVKLISCNAITQGGVPVFYYEGLYGDVSPCAVIPESIRQTDVSELAVIISVDPYKLIPVGEPDPDEIPLRHPHVLPHIGLHIMPKDQINRSFFKKNFLPVAEIRKQGNMFILNHDYIPPVQRSFYHAAIKTFTEQLDEALKKIRDDIKLIYSRNIDDRRRNILATNTFRLCEAFQTFYNNKIFFIEQLAPDLPPVFLIQAVNELANNLSSALQTFSETEKEQLLQYYYEWTDIIPSDFIMGIENVVGLVYRHTDISRSLQITSKLISLLKKMFGKMCELEYIGMMRENIVVGDESQIADSPIETKTWSFM